MRGDFQRVDSSVGSLTTNHPLAPGLYKIKVVRADKVAERLRTLAKDLGIQEVALLTWTHDSNARRRSYELMAKEFGLTAMPAAA